MTTSERQARYRQRLKDAAMSTVTVRLFFDERARYHGLDVEDVEYQMPPREGDYFLHEVKDQRFSGKITKAGYKANIDLEGGLYWAYVETIEAFQLSQNDDPQFERAFAGA